MPEYQTHQPFVNRLQFHDGFFNVRPPFSSHGDGSTISLQLYAAIGQLTERLQQTVGKSEPNFGYVFDDIGSPTLSEDFMRDEDTFDGIFLLIYRREILILVPSYCIFEIQDGLGLSICDSFEFDALSAREISSAISYLSTARL